MRTSLVLLLSVAASAAALGADPSVTIKIHEAPPAKSAENKPPPRPTQAKPLEIYQTEPMDGLRIRKRGHVQYSGAAVQCFRSNPLQLINPLAPVQYGTWEANPARDPAKGDIVGVKVVGIGF